MENQEKKQDKTKLLILLLLLITLIAVGVTLWALFFRSSGPELTPDYAPQEMEARAETIPDDDGEKMDKPEGGGSVSLTYSNKVTIDLSDKAATLYFANPGKSNTGDNAVTASVAYSQEDDYTEITDTFDVTSANVAAAASQTFNLTLSGKPNKAITAGTKIGTVTVTIAKADAAVSVG